MPTWKHIGKTFGGRNNLPPPVREEQEMYRDINSNEIVTREQLYKEYLQMQAEQPEEYNYSFPEYIRNCKTENGGSLETITK